MDAYFGDQCSAPLLSYISGQQQEELPITSEVSGGDTSALVIRVEVY